MQHGAELGRRFHGRAGALAAVVSEQWFFHDFETFRRNEDRPWTLARDTFGRGAQKTRREFFVDSAMANDYQVGDFGALTNLIGNESYIQEGLVSDMFLLAALCEVVQNRLAPLLQDFTHLCGKIQIGLKSQRPGDVMEKGSFDRNSIDDVLTENGAVKIVGNPNSIIQRRCGMFRAVERKQNSLDHRPLRSFIRSPLQAQAPFALRLLAPCFIF